MKINYIIPAGGIGHRFGSEIPKQFIKLAGKPIIIRTLESIQTHPATSRIVVPLHDSWHEHFEKLLAQWDLEGIEITNGGISRHDSISVGLAMLGDRSKYIAIHDAVRPLFTHSLLDALIENLKLTGSAIPVLPVTDTIKLVDSTTGQIKNTVDREYLRAAQTPQMFRTKDYIPALKAMKQKPTDDSSVLELNGLSPSYVRGEEGNIKITTPHDMLLAELLIKLTEKQLNNLME